MVKHENFTFAVSLSVCDYLTKAEASAALIKSESGPTMSWVTKEVTMDEMLNFCITWPEYWSFSFSISPSSEYSGLISLRMDWFNLLAIEGTLKSLLQHHNS